MNFKVIIHIICLFLFFKTSLLAQDKMLLDVIPLEHRKELSKYDFTTKEIDKEEINVFLKAFLSKLYTDGFASASIDSVLWSEERVKAYLYIGKRYFLKDISVDEALQPFYSPLERNRKQRFHYEDIERIKEKTLSNLENNGYPFAVLFFDAVKIENDSFSIKLSGKKGPIILFDTLENRLEAKIFQRYLQAYTGIKPNAPYSESKLNNLDVALKKLPFLELEEPSKTYYKHDKSVTEVYLKNKKISRFDFLIGVLPNNQETKKLLITGQAALDLRNPFGTGKRISFQWSRLQPRSQKLDLFFDYPYIVGSPIGADIAFELDKRDTLFLDLTWKVGINYLIDAQNKVALFVKNDRTIVLNVDTGSVRIEKTLPTTLDQSSVLYGLKLKMDQLNYPYNPTNGFFIEISGAMGTKKIKQNSSITSLSEGDFSFESLYDSISTRSIKGELSWEIAKYFSLGKRQVLKTSIVGASLINKDLLKNELFRIGGTNLLRGFDEESVLASTYNVATLEYRFLLDKNAYFYTFFDAAFKESRTSGNVSHDFPFGFGAGMTFETKAGIFGVSYAMGRQENISIDPKNSKIHFGYINIF